MRTIAAAMAACVAAGCATSQRTDAPTVVRTKAPAHYQETVTNYFDIMMRGPQTNRKLAFGSPEASDCAIHGSGGYHQGWMVPVIYDTSPVTSTAPTVKGAKTSTSGTAAANKPVQATVNDDGVASATLSEVKISGKGYFFWFSSDTIAAVTRRADSCPP
ncbi:MAG TPA: hypothetical protein VF169_26730 [Albitalea sp.]|uniref:hypothetical protein n=1 Tax=Piscinibacter sp. TaxID=1903157 RepID=UPI002ED53A68